MDLYVVSGIKESNPTPTMKIFAADLVAALKKGSPNYYLDKAFPSVFKAAPNESYCIAFQQGAIPLLEKYNDLELIGFGGHSLAFKYYDRILKISDYFSNLEVYQRIQKNPSLYYGNILNLQLVPNKSNNWPEQWLIIEQEKLEIPSKITLPLITEYDATLFPITTHDATLFPITAPSNYYWNQLIKQMPTNSILHKLEADLNESITALISLGIDVPKYKNMFIAGKNTIDWWITLYSDQTKTQIEMKNILLKEGKYVLFDYSTWQIKLTRKEKRLVKNNYKQNTI